MIQNTVNIFITSLLDQIWDTQNPLFSHRKIFKLGNKLKYANFVSYSFLYYIHDKNIFFSVWRSGKPKRTKKWVLLIILFTN